MSVQAEKLCTRLRAEGVHADLIPTNPNPPRWLGGLGRVPVARTILREIQYLISLTRIVRQPGVVHHFSASNLFFFLHSAPLLLMGRWFRLKTVLNYRGGRAADFLGKWSWMAVPLLRRADALTVPSAFLQRVFHDAGLAASVLPNLADTEQFVFRKRDHFSPCLFVTRNLEPIYDIECVLRTFRVIQTQMPEASLGIAGEGSESGRLKDLVKQWNLRAVTFYGAVPHEKLPTLYRQHDIYVNASRVDNFPGALVEAACAGLPIVTTRAGGIPEMIADRQNGLLVEIGDSDALANCVSEIVSRPEFARRLAHNARGWAEQFSWQNVFPQLLRCYGMAADFASSELQSEPVVVN